ncbi:MAG: S8 family peptidase [Bacteroidales bacterium]|jgi:subtilisin family serine protease|nr:S8 family peptidase [Bacteroidales bacterium]
MKKIILFTVLQVSISIGLFAQTDFFYSKDGKKEEFKIRKDKVLVKTKSLSDAKRISEQAIFRTAYNLNDERVIATIDTLKVDAEKLKQSQDIIDASYFLEYTDGTLQSTTNQIFVKSKNGLTIKQAIDKTKLKEIVETIELIDVTHEIYLITLKINIDEVLGLTRILFESGCFEFAEPSFLRLIKPSNTYYSSQWGLKNTGQNGGTARIDINAESAWNITNGSSNIKVAVIDEGVDLTHLDLQANIISGYDAISAGSSPGGANGSPYGNDAHGTTCAGIIAAENNTIGIRGVASNVKIVPVRIAYKPSGSNGWITNDTWIVNGIHYAWFTAQADVLSNSWGGGSSSSTITAEINAAITQGRNGKGCVVVFASGNNNASSVSYPASLSNVIAVGAISQCGTRKRSSSNLSEVNQYVNTDPLGVSCDGEGWWGSNYGTMLDIVAPGVSIYTTDIQGSAGYVTGDYRSDFNGTSAACPHVAGVAALILSIRPDLTQAQVRQAIESTCTKINTYTYSNNSNHPNGTWNSQVGHGLVNAYAALQNVIDISGPSIVPCTGNVTYASNISGTWTVSENLQIVSGQGTSSITVRKVSSNTTVVRYASVSIGGKTKNILIGSPKVTSIDGPGVAGNGLYYFSPNPYFPSTAYSCSWLIHATDGSGTSNFQIVQNINNYMGVKFNKPGTYLILCAYSNACATSSEAPAYKTLTVTQNDLVSTPYSMAIDSSTMVTKDYKIENSNAETESNISTTASGSIWSSAYPNPASNELRIDKTEENGMATTVKNVENKTSEIRVLLYSHSTAKLVYNKIHSSAEKQIRIDTSKFPNGVYYLNMIANNEKIKEQTIVVQH